MAFCNLAKTLSLAAVSLDGGVVQFQWMAADVTAFESGSPHACAHSLDDEVALKLCDGADDDHDGSAQRSAGVDLLAETDELDAYPVQVVEHIEEVTSGACDAIARPDQHDAEAAAAGSSRPRQLTMPTTSCRPNGLPPRPSMLSSCGHSG